MKISKILTTTILLGSLSLALAEVNIDAQIAEIKSASSEDRPALMNELKTQIANMSEEDRINAMTQLRTNMQGTGMGKMNREQKRVRNMGDHQMNQQMMEQKRMHTQNGQMGSSRPAGAGTGGGGSMSGGGMGGNGKQGN